MLMEPDIILPSQFLPRTLATPERRLLLAVLEEAVGTFQRFAVSRDRRNRALFAEVEEWIASDDALRLYSFVGICDALGMDATCLRAGLSRWLAARRVPPVEVAQPLYRFPFRRVNGTRIRTTGRAEGASRRA